jgi:hypothetical protein
MHIQVVDVGEVCHELRPCLAVKNSAFSYVSEQQGLLYDTYSFGKFSVKQGTPRRAALALEVNLSEFRVWLQKFRVSFPTF